MLKRVNSQYIGKILKIIHFNNNGDRGIFLAFSLKPYTTLPGGFLFYHFLRYIKTRVKKVNNYLNINNLLFKFFHLYLQWRQSSQINWKIQYFNGYKLLATNVEGVTKSNQFNIIMIVRIVDIACKINWS